MRQTVLIVFILGIVLSLASQAIAQFNYAFTTLQRELEGADIYAQDKDKTYLGKITNGFGLNSVVSEYGNYGNKFSSTSIWNEFGKYGGRFGQYSPFNSFSSAPPVIIKNNKIVGYLSISQSNNNNLDPNILRLFK
ncbi:MAG: hypothetical protein PHG32_05030 [Candidatus Cloacimonetes bacterium]|nr:hypothetical protein [Candidatus Cloacimonadota bacterium]